MRRTLSRIAAAFFRRRGLQVVDDTDPWPTGCEVCGGPTAVHLTEVRGRVKRQRHFCSKHVPRGLPLPTREEEFRSIERMLAAAQDHESQDKDATLRQLKKLEEYVRSRQGSIADFFNMQNAQDPNPGV